MENGHKLHSLEYLPVLSGNYIIHYTCNAPKQKVLDKYKILSIGDQFGCKDNREVLKVPVEAYKKAGFSNLSDKNILNLNLESLMRRLK